MLKTLLGQSAEVRAESFLVSQGLTPVARNWHCRFGEIDLIMQDGATRVFVEVRLCSRSDFSGAAASVTPAKQRKLLAAARQYLTTLKSIPPAASTWWRSLAMPRRTGSRMHLTMWDNQTMPLQDRIHGHFQASARIKLDAADALTPLIEQAARLMVHCLAQGGKILACGNGGSAADAQHFASLMINRFEQERPGLAAIALTTDASTLTSIANDYAFDQVFARQLKALGQPGDILLAISTSGNSPSVLQAVTAAHARSMHVIVLTGHSGGRLAEQIAGDDVFLCVRAESTARIQEVHQLTIHCLCDAVDSVLLGVEE